MGATAIVNLIAAMVAGVPKVIQAIKDGKDPKDIKLGDFVSTDALATVREANARAQSYING